VRTRKQFLDEYGVSHRNPINQVVHFVCIPVIVFSTLGLLWRLPVGGWLGLAPDTAAWVNGATLLGIGAGVFYARLSLRSLLVMTAWFAVCIAGIRAIDQAGGPLLGICAGAWVLAWAAQIWGHAVEGAKPSFADDLVFLLIGPLFVIEELKEKIRA